MATGDLAPRSNNSVDMLTQLLTTFKGGPTTTQTSSETVSNDKATAYLQQILGGTGGLAAVSSGQKAAGMYNSTVNTQLTNDLLARAAGQTAALSSTKTSTSQVGPAANPLMTLAALGGGQILGSLAGPALKAGKKKLGLDDIGQNISDALFGPSSGSSGTIASTLDPATLAPYPAALDTASVGTEPLKYLDDVKQTGNSDSMGDLGSSSSGGLTAGELAAGAAGATAIGAAATAGGTAAATAGGYVVGAETAAWGTAAAAGTAEAAGATAAGAGFLDTIGTVAVALWIVCTELNKQGRLPTRWYRYGAREFLSYDSRGKQGYYIWAIPSVKHLRKHPYSLYSKLMCSVFNARAEYLAAKAGCPDAKKTIYGAITTHGLYGFCWILSRTIARTPVTVAQILGV